VSRTSSDSAFRSAFSIAVVSLVVLCGLFLGLSYAQGPKLESAQVDTSLVTSASGQTIRMFANQALDDVTPEQVAVAPAVPFSVSTSGEIVAVTFGERLSYDTEYSVTVVDARSAYGGTASTLTHSFRTGAPTLHYLDRGVDRDAIMRTTLSGSTSSEVYSATRIQDFAVVSPTVFAVVIVLDDATSQLNIVDTTSGLVEDVGLPADGAIEAFQSSDSGTVLGFEFTSVDGTFERTLFTLDLDKGRDLVPAVGLDGEPLSARHWMFVPGSERLVVQTTEQVVLSIDEEGSIQPLGSFLRIGDLSPDGTVLTVYDTFGASALTLATLESARLDASPVDGLDATAGQVVVLPDGSRVQKVAVFDEETGGFRSLVVIDDGVGARVLYETPQSLGSIESFTVSPNGQFAAIEVVPDFAASVSDGYELDARSTSVQTVIVQLGTGAVVRSVEGFALDW